MSDILKISKDKRHRSSSSLAGTVLEGTRSERKLDFNASIPEVDDKFAVAEARCDDLQEKIEMIKLLKRKRKLKKRSMTRVTDQQQTVPENVPIISVRTQPKKKVSQQAARLHRLETAPNPTRGYLDPATVEQHRMIGQMRNQIHHQEMPIQNRQVGHEAKFLSRNRNRRSHAEGDNMSSQGVQISHAAPASVHVADACSTVYEYPAELNANIKTQATPMESRYQTRAPIRRRHVPRDLPMRQPVAVSKWAEDSADEADVWQHASDAREYAPAPAPRRVNTRTQGNNVTITTPVDERPVVELFNKNRSACRSAENHRSQPSSAPLKHRDAKVQEAQRYEEQDGAPLEDLASHDIRKEVPRHPHRVKYRTRRYELPTVASQMKQAGMRCYYGNANSTNIPFVVSKSTAPSHNIGVNIQQVLNGIKIQQPLSGIPLTMAHHMGLGHLPSFATKSATIQQPSLDNREINVIRVGQRQLRLPSYKYISYSRLLSLYREGDGMVPRFLRAISRPHYFYTSMFNLTSNQDDFDAATSKGRGGGQEAKQSLAEYANLYREYEHIDKCLQEGACEPELERRKEELTRQLEAREQHIRRVVQEYRASGEADPTLLRASASTAEEGYRHSTYKLNVGDPEQN